MIATTDGFGILSWSKGHLLVGFFKSVVRSPGCCMLKKSDFPSGANHGPVSSASLGAEATLITLPA